MILKTSFEIRYDLIDFVAASRNPASNSDQKVGLKYDSNLIKTDYKF